MSSNNSEIHFPYVRGLESLTEKYGVAREIRSSEWLGEKIIHSFGHSVR